MAAEGGRADQDRIAAADRRQQLLRWCEFAVDALHPHAGAGNPLGEGIGDVAIANSYYIGKLMASDEPEKQKAKAILGVAFPSLGAHGTHVNISGAGVAAHAPHPDAAAALLEFLSGTEAQALFAEGNKEYPVKAGVPLAKELEAFGTFTMDSLNLRALARLNAEAVKAMDAAGWR